MTVFTEINTMAITGSQLAGFRKDLGLTQEQLAKELDVPRSTLVDWERRKDTEIPVRAYSKFRSYCNENFKANTKTQNFEDIFGRPVGIRAAKLIGSILGRPNGIFLDAVSHITAGPIGKQLGATIDHILVGPIGRTLGATASASSPADSNKVFKIKCPHCEKSITIPNLNDCTYDCPYCLQLFKFRDGGPVITAGKAE